MKKKLVTFFQRYRHAEMWIGTIALLFLVLFALLELSLHAAVTTLPRTVVFRIILLVLICILLYLAVMLYAERTHDKSRFPPLISFFFFLYTYLLLNITLFEKGFGRDSIFELVGASRESYFQDFVNLIPFQSIWRVYIVGLVKGFVSPYYVGLNLLGNMCIFMPISFFLPAIWDAQKKWYVFLLTLTLCVLGVEFLQLFFMVGSCDIDDLILNVCGASLLYTFFRTPRLASFIARVCGKSA